MSASSIARRGFASPYDQPLRATLFPSVKTAVGECITLSLHEFDRMVRKTSAARKESLPLISFCRFADDRRSKATARAFSAIMLDYDGGKTSMRRAERKLREAGLAAMLYETPSSTPNAPRWRAIIPMSEDLPAERYRRMVDRADNVLGHILAPESYSEAQIYYFGSVGRGSQCRTCLI